MNQLAALTLGFELPLFKARDAVMQQRKRSPVAAVRFQNQVVCLDLSSKVSYSSVGGLKDDDTASTVSSSDDSSVSSCAGSVSFAEELVTAVYERPATTFSEKQHLFWSDLDYRQFRRNYCLYKLELQRNSKVKFSEDVVSDVYEYPNEGEKDELFYTEKELQRFLDDFVASLNQHLS